MKHTNKLLCAIAILLGIDAQADAIREKALKVFETIPSTIPALENNPVIPEKINLGKALFFDPRISTSGVFSCNSCHNLALEETIALKNQ